MSAPIVSLTQVESSNIKAVGLDVPAEVLTVEFKNGAVYTYANVALSDYKALLAAPSLGGHFNKYIKAHPETFPFTRIRGTADEPISAPDSPVFAALDGRLAQLRSVETALAALNDQRKSLRAAIQATLIATGAETYHGDGVEVTTAGGTLQVTFAPETAS